MKKLIAIVITAFVLLSSFGINVSASSGISLMSVQGDYEKEPWLNYSYYIHYYESWTHAYYYSNEPMYIIDGKPYTTASTVYHVNSSYGREELVNTKTSNIDGVRLIYNAQYNYDGVFLNYSPTEIPISEPTAEPTVEPTVEPTTEPTVEPTVEPTTEPAVEPTVEPTTEPTIEPTDTPIISDSTEEVEILRSISNTLNLIFMFLLLWWTEKKLYLIVNNFKIKRKR